MRLGERLKQVVVANFIEISRDEEAERAAAATAAASAAAVPAAPTADANQTTVAAAQTPPSPSSPAYLNSVDTSVLPPVVEAALFTPPAAAEKPDPTDAARWFAADAPGGEFAGILVADGTPDFDRLFQNADLPAVSCTAEEAGKILAEMPTELPMRVRRITARATVDRLSQANPAALSDILSDASMKMVRVARFAEKTGDRANALKLEISDEIAALEAKIAERRAVLEEIDARQQNALKACRARMAELNDVVLFFDHPDVAAARTDAPDVMPTAAGVPSPTTDDELPPYLRDDSVRRMLGLQNGAGKDLGAPDAPAEEPRRPASRRKPSATAGDSV